MNRRSFIAAAPAVALAGPVAAETETPVAALFKEWRDLEDVILRGFDADEPEHEERVDRQMAVVHQITALPALSERDWIMKAIAASDGGDMAMIPISDPALWAEARALVA